MLTILMTCVLLGLGSSPVSGSQPNLCPANGHHFNYDPNSSKGQAHWPKISPCCGSTVRQSPRDLPLDDIPKQLQERPYTLQFYNSQQQTGFLYNNGHAPNIAVTSAQPAYVRGVPYAPQAKYILDGIHFHFSDGSIGGSEHALNGERFDGEMHMVHYKEDYGSVGQSVLHEDGLMVIGVFLEGPKGRRNLLRKVYGKQRKGPRRNLMKSIKNNFLKGKKSDIDSPLNELLGNLANVQGIGKAGGTPVAFNVTDLLPCNREFLTYAGSLTTPPCSESVRWIVMVEPQGLSKNSLKLLRSLPAGSEGREEGLIADFSNARDLQDNREPVEANF